MHRRDFLKASLAGVPFLLGFKLPEMTMLEELRTMLYDPNYKFFEDDRQLQIHLDRAVAWLDPKNIWWHAQTQPKLSLKDLARDVAKDPYRRELALKGAVHFARLDGPYFEESPEAYALHQEFYEKGEEDFRRLISWWEHRGDERIFRRSQRELGIQMAETERWCLENPA